MTGNTTVATTQRRAPTTTSTMGSSGNGGINNIGNGIASSRSGGPSGGTIGGSHTRFGLNAYVKGSPKAVICVPLFVPGGEGGSLPYSAVDNRHRTFGVLEIMNVQNTGFTLSDEKIAETCANMLSSVRPLVFTVFSYHLSAA